MSVAQLTSIRKWLAGFAVETPVNGVNNGQDPITLDAEASPSDGQDSTKATLGFPASHPSRQKGLQDIDFPD
ncbi:hypothetical protein COL922a_012179 [Colletotrichum nupharicola]|nr:hypothetical protein COL922a_012179 [Colletotrichum nupharicola]